MNTQTETKPYEHINAAVAIAQDLDEFSKTDLDLTVSERIALAQLHIAVANAKMLGGRRA